MDGRFHLQEFKKIVQIFSVYSSTFVTPMAVLQRLRLRNKIKEIAILSDAFERLPGYSLHTIQEFVDVLRGKVLVQ